MQEIHSISAFIIEFVLEEEVIIITVYHAFSCSFHLNLSASMALKSIRGYLFPEKF